MRLPPVLDDLLARPVVRRWRERAGRSVVRIRRQLEPLTRRIQRKHVVLAGGIVALAAAVVAADVVIGSPGAGEIRTIGNLPVATVVLDKDDAPAFTIFAERRFEVPLDRISPHMIDAVIAIEDQRFYRHRGLDLWRIAGSLWANIWSGRIEQGGSTITQQLAKLSFLTPDKTLRRKLKEAYLAIRLEQIYSKEEILEIYLNKVYFGDGLPGGKPPFASPHDDPIEGDWRFGRIVIAGSDRAPEGGADAAIAVAVRAVDELAPARSR